MRRECGIIMSGAMVRALLEGRKRQTRRVVKRQPNVASDGQWDQYNKKGKWLGAISANGKTRSISCPYGVPGDLLYVRETWCVGKAADGLKPRELDPRYWRECGGPWYRADYPTAINFGFHYQGKTRPSIFMPKWAARIWLEITEVRVERVAGISGADCIAEGMRRFSSYGKRGYTWNRTGQPHWLHAPAGFRALWDDLNEKRGYGWDVNPWVWVVGFKKREREKDNRE